MLHEGTFVLSSLARLLWLPRPNLVVAVSPPLSLGVAAWAAGWVKRAPFIFHVQDLQPDAAAGLGLVKSRWLLPLLYRLERFAYRKAARVGGISPGMLAAFQRKGVPAEKCLYFPNSIVLTPAAPPPAPGSFRRRHGFAPDDFLIVYSGNLGVKQGLDVLLEVARLGGQPRARFVLCGDGNQREALAAKAARDRLSHVHLLPLQPAVQYQEMLHDADVCAITQQSGAGQCFFPSKLLPALAAGKAVLAVAEADSELARAVATGGFGLWVPPGQPVPLALAIGELIGQPEKLAAFGQAALRFVAQFERTRVLRRFTVELGKLTELFSVGP
jgi:colanic acid biosynthesis glycosyl transferase WcaI